MNHLAWPLRRQPGSNLALGAAAAVYIGAVISLAGMYWDSAWHTDFGRDTFWSPPHLLLYAGVMVVGGAVGSWGLLELGERRSLWLAAKNPRLFLAGIGIAATLAAAPVDDVWHELFGRDSVVWSPPHLLGLSGVFTAMAAVLLEVRRFGGGAGRALTTMGVVTLLGSLLVLVFEYDTDVPQFAVAWYLPLVTAAAALAFALARVVTDDRWIATKAAAVYTLLMSAVSVGLTMMDHTAPIIPAVLVPAVAVDGAVGARLGRAPRAMILAVAVFAAYVPYLNVVLAGTEIAPMEMLVGLPLAMAVAWMGDALVTGKWSRPRRLAPVLGTVLALTITSAALAHDPGQGEVVGEAAMRADRSGSLVTVSVDISDCGALEPKQLTARRAGGVRSAPLAQAGGCRFSGELVLPDRGQWFVYAELLDQGRPRETWMPVLVGDGSWSGAKATELYAPRRPEDSSFQQLAGIVLYGVNLALVIAVVVLYRRERARTPLGRRAATVA